MRTLIIATLITLITILPGRCADNSGPVLNEAERARLARQVQSMEKSKREAAQNAASAIKRDATRNAQSVDQNVKQQKEKIDKAAQSLSWYYGNEAATAAAAAKKKQLEAAAAAEKQKIANDAKRRAMEQATAAQKSVHNIQESVTGLKSQVAKKGQYGLQPQGSNLHVRNYGTK